MAARVVQRFCEACGRRYDLPVEAQDAVDLDQIRTAFRFCLSCGQSVGSACCWDPWGESCAACARSSSIAARRSSEQSGDLRAVRRGLARMADGVLAVQRYRIGLEKRVNRDGPMARDAWLDEWWDAAWLVLQADTSRDAAYDSLMRAAGKEARGGYVEERLHDLRGRYLDLGAELAVQSDGYHDARAGIERSLRIAEGPEVARRAPAVARADGTAPKPETARRPTAAVDDPRAPIVEPLPQPKEAHHRRPTTDRRAPIPGVLVVAGLAVAAGFAALVVLGGVGEPDATQNTTVGGVLSARSQATPASTLNPSPGVSQLAANLDFNMMSIGSLSGASSDIERVTGEAEVVSFPSPFDRSVRLSGSGPNGFCVDAAGLGEKGASVNLDLYATTAPTSGQLEVTLASSAANATTVPISLNLMTDLPARHWYGLRATIDPGSGGAVDVLDHGNILASRPFAAIRRAVGFEAPSVCISVSGMSRGVQLLLDNVQVHL